MDSKQIHNIIHDLAQKMAYDFSETLNPNRSDAQKKEHLEAVMAGAKLASQVDGFVKIFREDEKNKANALAGNTIAAISIWSKSQHDENAKKYAASFAYLTLKS